MWLETKGVPDNKQYMLILQLLGKGLCCWEFSLPCPPNKNDKEQQDHAWATSEGSSTKTTSFRSYKEQILSNCHQQENYSLAASAYWIDFSTRQMQLQPVLHKHMQGWVIY